MQFQFKVLSLDAVPRALEKAVRYRLLNEPSEAESICLDALEVDPHNQEAITTLLLALTDQFEHNQGAVRRATETLQRLDDEYERRYYAGLIHERHAKALLRNGTPRAGSRAFHWLREAMMSYEHAEVIRPENNDDAILRWNACARLIMRDTHLAPAVEEPNEPLLLE
ncbi:MAG TPA: hypothetical protein VNZ26_33675 [Vicinamibacterales bacterium]|jgi:hypothetical protein|nr:hypothetical protein [Vicinamibacterales bacterium]